MSNKISKKMIERMAIELRDYIVSHGLWQDCRIYFNGKCFDSRGRIIENIDPHDYFEYASDILSMSFEGDLYDIFNDEWGYDYLEDINKIFSKYGCYYELGNAWNLTAVLI